MIHTAAQKKQEEQQRRQSSEGDKQSNKEFPAKQNGADSDAKRLNAENDAKLQHFVESAQNKARSTQPISSTDIRLELNSTSVSPCIVLCFC